MTKRAATFLMIAIVAVVMLAALFIINRTTIFQEGNPVPVAKGIWALIVKGEPYAKIKNDPPVYITRPLSHDRLFSFIEATYGVKFTKEDNGKYVFTGKDKTVTLVTRRYSKSFQVWEVEGP